jgi:hypothetical protein
MVQNFCIESSCMFNLTVLIVWYTTFGVNHPVCSTCLFFMSESKLLDGIFLYVQCVSTSCLVQNLWMESPCMLNLAVLNVWFNIWMESSCMFNLSVLHVCFKTCGWMESPCRFNLSVLHVWFRTCMESPCMFKLSVLHVWFKTFGWKFVPCMFNLSTSCLVQKLWIESPCMFNFSVLHVWFKTFVLNHPVCSTWQYLMSGTQLLEWITLYVQLVCSSCQIQNF